MRPGPRGACILAALALTASACTDGPEDGSSTSSTTPTESPLRDRPLPPPVSVAQQPDDAVFSDPKFEALPGATADFGTLGGATYQIEVPDDWNGRLLLWMHGFEDLATEAHVTPPDIRRLLISRGYAWGASSFSSTSLIPGRAADETAALWDYFVGEHGRPTWTYVGGQSMGGWAAHIAAERYANRFDGALGLCGAVGTEPGLRIAAEFFIAAAHVAGVTQAEFEGASGLEELIDERIKPTLDDPAKHAQFEDLMIALTGGPRAFAREGFHLEEETNWRRALLVVAAGLVPPRGTPYDLAPGSSVTGTEYEAAVLRIPANDAALEEFSEGMEVTGDLRIPLLSLHTTGDGQVPIGQAQILRQRADEAGRGDQLVQRVIEDPGHCGFTTGEQEDAFETLVAWVEKGDKPDGTNLDVDDLSTLDRTFELAPRPGTPAADETAAARERALLTGRARLDGAAFDARWIGAVVRDRGLVTPCQLTLPAVDDGHFEITVLADDESAGCGRPGAEILLWTFVDDQELFSTNAIPWPVDGTEDVEVTFSPSSPLGAMRATTDFNGEVYRSDGAHAPLGIRVEAFVGTTLCGMASVRSDGYFILSVVGPDSLPGCERGGHLTFVVDGKPALETADNTPAESRQLDLTIP